MTYGIRGRRYEYLRNSLHLDPAACHRGSSDSLLDDATVPPRDIVGATGWDGCFVHGCWMQSLGARLGFSLIAP